MGSDACPENLRVKVRLVAQRSRGPTTRLNRHSTTRLNRYTTIKPRGRTICTKTSKDVACESKGVTCITALEQDIVPPAENQRRQFLCIRRPPSRPEIEDFRDDTAPSCHLVLIPTLLLLWENSKSWSEERRMKCRGGVGWVLVGRIGG
jgi:hypothetical protein